MKKFYMIIGIPGTGKTTKAKEIIETYKKENKMLYHYEADMFFEKDGKYEFDKTKLKQAHMWCFNNFKEALKQNVDVIVSNTFVNMYERRKYIREAVINNYEIEVITMTTEYGSIHNVPEYTIKHMKKLFQPFTNKEIEFFKSI